MPRYTRLELNSPSELEENMPFVWLDTRVIQTTASDKTSVGADWNDTFSFFGLGGCSFPWRRDAGPSDAAAEAREAKKKKKNSVCVCVCVWVLLVASIGRYRVKMQPRYPAGITAGWLVDRAHVTAHTGYPPWNGSGNSVQHPFCAVSSQPTVALSAGPHLTGAGEEGGAHCWRCLRPLPSFSTDSAVPVLEIYA